MSVPLLSSTGEHVKSRKMLNARQVARMLQISLGGVHSAVHQGRLPKYTSGRYSLFRVEDVEAYQRFLENGKSSKGQARELLERYPECPAEVAAKLPSPRYWHVFTRYAQTGDSYETIGIDERVSRERVRQMVQSVVDKLIAHAEG